jgi:pilus assembly protein CpaC
MHLINSHILPRFGALVLFGLATAGSVLLAQEPAPPPRPADGAPPRAGDAALPKPPDGVAMRSASGAIIVPVNMSQTLRMSTKKPISSVRLNVDGIVRVSPNAIDPTSVVLTGMSAGSARLTLTDVDGKDESFDIIVQVDVTYVRRAIADSFPTANVEVRPVSNKTIILGGWVARIEDIDPILRVARSVVGPGGDIINAMQVGGVMQVQLDVTVASVSRTKIRARGFNWAINGKGVSGGSILGSLASPSPPGQAAAAAGGVGMIPSTAALTPNVGGNSGTNLVFGIVPANAQFLIQMLKNENLAKILAEPKIVTLSGRPAHFLSGGQQATLGPSSGITGPGVVYMNVGTELDFLPIVQGTGRIYLEVTPKVTSVDQTLGITVAGSVVPGFKQQEERTVVEMEPGQTMAIGGMIQTSTQSTANRVPIIGEIPFLGGFFNTVSVEDDEQELIILVTPHLVDAMDCRQAPKQLPGQETRSPDDYELFLEYLLEVPRGKREVFEGGRYKVAYKNDPTASQYPCADNLPKESRRGRNDQNSGCCAPQTGAPGLAPPIPAQGGNPAGMPGQTMPAPAQGNSQQLPARPNGAGDGRMIPPTTLDGQPAAGRPNIRWGPVIPAPQLDEGTPR